MNDNIVEIGGERYFIFGKTYIKITEHFSQNGRTYDEIITDLVKRHKTNEKKAA